MIIFLDIDGVMTPATIWRRLELMEDGFHDFTKKSVQALNQLIDDETEIILTTSHAMQFTIAQWKNIFEKRNVKSVKKMDVLTHLPARLHSYRKNHEFERWFLYKKHANEVNDFVIIDDDRDLNDLPAFMKQRLILTRSWIGLTIED